VAQNPLRLLISLLAYILADTGEHFLSYKKATTRFYEGPILKPPEIKKAQHRAKAESYERVQQNLPCPVGYSGGILHFANGTFCDVKDGAMS